VVHFTPMEMTIDAKFWREFDRRLDAKLEEKLDAKLEEKLDKMLDKKLDTKFEENFAKYFQLHLEPFKRETKKIHNDIFDELMRVSSRVCELELNFNTLNDEMAEGFDAVHARLDDHGEQLRIVTKHIPKMDTRVVELDSRVRDLEKAA